MLPCFAFSVFAETHDIDYQDWIGRVEVNGEAEIVTLYLPELYYEMYLYTSDGDYHGNSLDLYLSDDSSFSLSVFPFGFNEDTERTMLSYNIPEGAEFFFSVSIQAPDIGDFNFDDPVEYGAFSYVYYMDSAHEVQYDTYGDLSFSVEAGAALLWLEATNVISNDYAGSFSYADDVYCFYPQMLIESIYPPVSGDYYFTIESLGVTMTIGDAMSSGGDNLQSEIVDQLQDQGKKLDAISGKVVDIENKLDDQWNADVTPNDPDGSDIVGDLDDIESGLRDSVSGGFNIGLDIFANATETISSYVTSFLVLSSILNNFMDIPFFNGILVVSLSLGLIGLLINLLGSIVGRARNVDARSSKSGGSKKGGK